MPSPLFDLTMLWLYLKFVVGKIFSLSNVTIDSQYLDVTFILIEFEKDGIIRCGDFFPRRVSILSPDSDPFDSFHYVINYSLNLKMDFTNSSTPSK
jgi:hypothetical protein